MSFKTENSPYSIRCLRAIEGFNGGRKSLAQKIGLSHQAISMWAFKQSIPPEHILKLLDLSSGKFSAEELLGKFDSREIK